MGPPFAGMPLLLPLLSRLAILLLLVCAVPAIGHGQTLALRGGVQVDLLIDPLVTPSASDASAKLMWKRLRGPSKILVSTSSPGQQFGLSVVAEKVKRGVSTGTIDLLDGMPSTELVVDAGKKRNGQCNLKYTASARPEQGMGQDVHTVTYTLTVQ